MKEQATENSNTCIKKFLSFFVNGKLYGIELELVQEVTSNTNISKIPLVKNYIKGLINIRSNAILVFDLSHIFDSFSAEITNESHVLILKTEEKIKPLENLLPHIKPELFGQKPIGFLVDQVGDIISISENDFEPLPYDTEKKSYKYFDKIAKLKNGLMVVLNCTEIISREA